MADGKAFRSQAMKRLILAVALIFGTSVAALMDQARAQTGHERLATFYFSEIHAFNLAFVKHLEQLDKCLGEMDRFEGGEEFLDPVECSAFNEMRSVAGALLEDIQPVIQSYIDTLQIHAESGYAGNTYDQVMEEQMEANALIKLYSVKFQQAKIQTERVRKTESEFVKKLHSMNKIMQEMLLMETDAQ